MRAYVSNCASPVPSLASSGLCQKSRLVVRSRFHPIHHHLAMSFVARRAALRAVPRARGFAAAAGKQSYREQQEALVAHAGGM